MCQMQCITGKAEDAAEVFFPDTPSGKAGRQRYLQGCSAMPYDPITPETVELQVQVGWRVCMYVRAHALEHMLACASLHVHHVRVASLAGVCTAVHARVGGWGDGAKM